MAHSSLGLRMWKVWVVVAATLILGALIGLFLGWQVWPVRWYDVDPSDLRLQHQINYVLMAADSLALTGNADVARERLYELMDEHTSLEQLANLVERVAVQQEISGDKDSAERVRQMSRAMGLPDPRVAEYLPPSQRATTGAGWGIYLMAVGGLLLAAVIVLWIVSQFRVPARAGLGEEADVEREGLLGRLGSVRSGPHWPAALSRPAPLGQAPVEPVDTEPEVEEDDWEQVPEQEENIPVAGPQPVHEAPAPETEYRAAEDSAGAISIPLEDTGPIPLASEPVPPWEEEGEVEELPDEEENPPEPTTVVATSHRAATAPESALGIYEARYTFGDDDLDLSFVIESGDKDFLGECGIGVVDVLRSEGGQQVDAFEIWLFDRSDVHAEARAILASDYAYRTTAVNARLSARGRLVLAQPGVQIPLETLSLRVTATVRDFGYAPDSQPANSYFSHLTVQLVAERLATTE